MSPIEAPRSGESAEVPTPVDCTACDGFGRTLDAYGRPTKDDCSRLHEHDKVAPQNVHELRRACPDHGVRWCPECDDPEVGYGSVGDR